MDLTTEKVEQYHSLDLNACRAASITRQDEAVMALFW